MMNDKNIDELFSDKLKDFEKTPPAYLLDNVMAGVSAARRKRRLMYWRIGSVAAALLLAFVAGWQISEYNSRDYNLTQIVLAPIQKEAEKEPPAPVSTATQAKILTAENKTQAAVHKPSKAKSTPEADTFADKPSNEEGTIITDENFAVVDTLKIAEVKAEQMESIAAAEEEKKSEDKADNTTLSSIDQQIMEQNRQDMQARNENQRKSRWIVGAQVSPAINVNRSSHSSQYAASMLNASNSKVDLGGGISVEYKPAKRWSVQSGIYYAGIAQTSGNMNSSRAEYANADNKGTDYFNAPVNIVSDKMMMNSTAGVIEVKNIPSGMVVGTNLEDKSLSTAVVVSDAKFIQNFQYLEIPLYLRYTLVDARFDVQLLGGISSNVLVGNNTYLDSNTGKSLIGKTQDMQDMSYSSTFGLGVKYGLSKRVFLNVEPRVKYYLNSLNNNPAVEYKPYTIGVFTGISYSF